MKRNEILIPGQYSCGLPNWFRKLKIDLSIKAIMADLIDRLGDKDYCYPKFDDISKSTGISVPTISKVILVLEEIGWVEITRVSNCSNRYYIKLSNNEVDGLNSLKELNSVNTTLNTSNSLKLFKSGHLRALSHSLKGFKSGHLKKYGSNQRKTNEVSNELSNALVCQNIPIQVDIPQVKVSESQEETQLDKKFNPSFNYLAQNTAKSVLRNKLISKLKLASSIVKKYSLRIKSQELLEETNYKNKLVPRWVEIIDLDRQHYYDIQPHIKADEICDILISKWIDIGLNHTPSKENLSGHIKKILEKDPTFDQSIDNLFCIIQKSDYLIQQQDRFFTLNWLFKKHNEYTELYNYEVMLAYPLKYQNDRNIKVEEESNRQSKIILTDAILARHKVIEAEFDRTHQPKVKIKTAEEIEWDNVISSALMACEQEQTS